MDDQASVQQLQQQTASMAQLLKSSQERKDSPLIWALEASKLFQVQGTLPSSLFPKLELGTALVSHLCWENNSSLAWKFVEQAINSRLVFPIHVLSLLASRVIPERWEQPEAYRLFLELVSRYGVANSMRETQPWGDRLIKCIDDALQLSAKYDIHLTEIGQVAVLFLFYIVNTLIDCTLNDWGIQAEAGMDKSSDVFMDTDMTKRASQVNEHREQLCQMNPLIALEVVEKITENRKAVILLRLAQRNLPEKFNSLLQKLDSVEAKRSTLPNFKAANQIFMRLSSNIQKACGRQPQLSKRQAINVLIDVGSSSTTSSHTFGVSRGSCWIPIDIYLENVMDGKQLSATSAINHLAGLIKTLKVMNRASWQETFQALWISSLRVVQRERDPLEGPFPHIDARLCILLSVTPLAVSRVIAEELETSILRETHVGRSTGSTYQSLDGNLNLSRRRKGLITALQALGQYSHLLSPPLPVVSAANNAATKAANFISNFKGGTDIASNPIHTDTVTKAVGDMRHLIVEACIARKLVDTSSYYWPGYVDGSVNATKDSMITQGSPWSNFMDGAPLSASLKQVLIHTPASSRAELEKLYHIALHGTKEEKSAAAEILCGASLNCGWNIQEHTVELVIKLLSPPVPPNFSGPGSHLLGYSSMLSTVLVGVSSVDNVHILSLHGMVPEVAASLMPLCEVFGSLPPKSSTGEDTSPYSIFSYAFLFLLRLWKFYRPPHEHYVMGRGPPLTSELTLEYLLALRNSRLHLNSSKGNGFIKEESTILTQPVYIDSFPKLKAWYFQNQACVASTLSGLSSSCPVHQIANLILNMIFRKMGKGGTSSVATGVSSSSGSLSSSSATTNEDAYQRPTMPGWELLEAVPFVLEATLTACAHGKLSSRDLITGLKDFVEFFPASLACMISFFAAEITRGIWKPVLMNGIDWPSPAEYLPSLEAEIQEHLAAIGMDVPCPHTDIHSHVMLPLPMAVMVSLTITFKLEKGSECIREIAGRALENAASGCPWPSRTIIGALWAHKVRRWHHFVVFSCSRAIIVHDKEGVVQLLRSCFNAFLGSSHSSSSLLNAKSGVNALLGNCISGHIPVAPGFVYLRSASTIHSMLFVTDIILKLVVEFSRQLAAGWTTSNSCPQNARWLKSCRISLAEAAARMKEVASLGASLICVSGGCQLVKILYHETLPTCLLCGSGKDIKTAGPVSSILEGYVMAYLVVLSGSFVWGVGCASPDCMKRSHVIGRHVEFLADAVEGKISLRCDPATWKAYVACFVGLVTTFTPAWISEVKSETLKKLALGLRGWHESELALSLLERGGPSTMGYAVDLFM